MNLKKKLDFCIIPSPYNKGLKNLCFITYFGLNKIDEKLCLEEDYEHIKHIMGQYDYHEIDYCIFESSDFYKIPIAELKGKLSEAGMRYSKPFEFNIMAELNLFHMDLMSQHDMMHQENIKNNIQNENIYFSTSPNVIKQLKTRIPEVGEKITLYFYLFLQCHWVNENDCILELIGDLYSKENNNTRNFLQITKSDFIRLDSNLPNTIMLQSTKNYGDFISEINLLHKGNFKFVKPIISPNGDMITKSREFIYNIIEIKKNINPVHRIVVEANLNQHYDNMIAISKKIKKEFSLEQKKIMSLEAVKPEMISLKQKLRDKMLNLAESDEFEKASMVKNDINFIDNKIKIIDTLAEKNITRQEYFKTFCLNP